MDRENELFEQSAERSANRPNRSGEASAERRVRQVRTRTAEDASRAANATRTAANNATRAAANTVRAASGSTARTANATRTAANTVRSASGSNARTAANTARPVSGSTARTAANTARPVRTAAPSQVQGRTPSQAAPRKVTSQDETIRQAAPRQAAPRQAAPKQVNPRQANPRQVASRQAAAGSAGACQSVRTAVGDGQKGSSQRGGNVRSSASSAKRGEKKKGGFKKFLLIYAAVLAVILIAGLLIFNSFIKKYEDNQPSNMVAGIVKQLNSNASSFLKSNSDQIKCLENVDTIIEESAAQMQGKQISFIENSDYRADAPSYNITADGTIVAKITLAKDAKGAFGLHGWKLSGLDVASYVQNTLSYNILVPEGATVTINGTELTDAYKVKDAAVPENLQTAAKYVSVPTFETYKVSGFANQPEVKAKAADGSDLGVSITSDTIVCQATTTNEFIESVDGLVNNAISAWGRHFINMGGNLSAYILEDCDYYGYIFGSATMDPIYTAFYEFESIADYEFTEKKASNYIRYSNDCFTVDVKYQMRVDFTTDRMSDTNQKLDATWVFITKNGGQDWYIVDCIYKS